MIDQCEYDEELVEPRYAVVPAGAVTDRSLEPRDLQVLCLLGRHTNKLGWCRRSQVKMAAELSCGRATVQRSLERLMRAGWLEQRYEYRYDGGDAACSYRVLLDGGDSAAQFDGKGAQEPPPASGHPRPPAGTGCPSMDGHLINDPCLTKRERESASAAMAGRGDVATTGPGNDGLSDDGRGKDAFLAKWPTAKVDDQARLASAWAALTPAERTAALDGIGVFIADLKRLGRRHVPAGWKYLNEKRWELSKQLPAAVGAGASDQRMVACYSRDWWAAFWSKVQRGEKLSFFLEYASNPRNHTSFVNASLLPPSDVIAAMVSVPSDGEAMARWREWLAARGVRLPALRGGFWVFLPADDPPMPGQSVWSNHEHEGV